MIHKAVVRTERRPARRGRTIYEGAVSQGKVVSDGGPTKLESKSKSERKKILAEELKNIITGTDVETEELVPGNQMLASEVNSQGNDGRDGNSNKDAVENIQDQDGHDESEREREKDEQGETKSTVDSARTEGEHPQDDEGGTLTREVWDYIRGTRQDVDLLLQMGAEVERLSKKDAEQAESQDVLYDRMISAILHKEEEVDNRLSLMCTDIRRVTRECQRTLLFLQDMNVCIESLKHSRGVETNEGRELLGQDQHKPVLRMKGLSRNELVKEVTKAVTRAVKREIHPADVKDTVVQPCEDYGDFS